MAAQTLLVIGTQQPRRSAMMLMARSVAGTARRHARLRLQRAQVVAAKVYELDSVFYQAMQIGTLETVGLDWRLIDQFVERIQQVTPEQVRSVARKYLTEEDLTVAVLDPLPMETGQVGHTASNGGGHEH